MQLFVLILADYSGTDRHTCDRTCQVGDNRTCHFNWNIEWLRTLSQKACGDCRKNMTSDCYNEGCFSADGHSKPIISVNELLHYPIISACEGDRIVIDVANNLQNGDSTAIHWHGMDMRDTQWMDGVPMVSQCPLPMADSLTYIFTANPHGTHWWHSHNGLQRGDGLAGPIIVRQPSQVDVHSRLYDTDTNKHIVMVTDWFHTSAIDKLTLLEAGGFVEGETPDNIVINGRGRSNKLDETKVNSTNIPYAKFEILPNSRTRFRAISHATLYCPMEITIDDHNLTVISSDGRDIQPVTVSTLTLNGGERYDFIVNASQPPANYWMRVKGVGGTNCNNISQKAIVRYDHESVSKTDLPSSSKTDEFKNLNPMLKQKDVKNPVYVNELRSVKNISDKLKGKPNETLFLELSFNPGPVINNIKYMPSDRPLLYQYDSIDKSRICNAPNFTVPDEMKNCQHVIKIKRDQLIEMVIFDKGDKNNNKSGHPIHLHGQSFAVVAMKRVDESQPLPMEKMKDIYHNTEISKNLVNPPMKDTVIIPNRGYTIVRFFSDNPGFWPLHCHILFHDPTMFLVIQVGEYEDIKESLQIPDNFTRCGSYKPAQQIITRPTVDFGVVSVGFKTSIDTLNMLFLLFSALVFAN